MNQSGPYGNSVNSAIPDYKRKVTYTSFKQLIRLAYNVGIGGFLHGIDMKDAYWSVPINKKIYHLMGISCRNKVIIFTCLPFGLATFLVVIVIKILLLNNIIY